jgi:4-amino-4-deoxy-L-arabinose transferase-like glycosyltransferase
VAVERRQRTLLVAALALLAGLVVYWLAVDLFPYHSVNDDEGVYLTQAAMLLEGRLYLRPGELGDLVRPWFFVAESTPEGVRFYSKYAPVAAGVFAVGMALGDPNLSLALVAAGIAALTYALTTAAFDRRVATLATLLLVGSPLFLFTSSTFLPYAPTTLFNLAFALCYVRAMRRDDPRWGVAAGAAVGVAFFARPYTAVLFAAPFIAHAVGSLWWTRDGPDFRPTLTRLLAVAVPGLVGVGVTLGYNALVTGDPFLFPYKAFGPNDGLGFGEHALLGYEREYTPELAAETTVRLLELLTMEWTVAGPVGTLLALAGLATLPADRRAVADPSLGRPALRAVVVGLVPAVVLGNAYFWGTLNGLENGLIGLLGPYYHFDLLLPLSAFGAAGTRTLWRRLRDATTRLDVPYRRAVLAVALLSAAVVGAGAEAAAVGDPYEENRLRTANLATTYDPMVAERTGPLSPPRDDERRFDRAVVLIPDPYGDWVHHPFQYLRNDPGFDGRAVYALNDGPDARFRALDATPDRRPYRFTYRGAWTGAVDPVESRLVPLDVARGDRVTAATTLGVPARATRARARVTTDEGEVRYRLGAVDGPVTVAWNLTPDGASLVNRSAVGNATAAALPEGPSEAHLLVTFVEPQGTTVTYRQTVTVDPTAGAVRVVWPPETRICVLTTDCGPEATYVGPDGDYVSGVRVETSNATSQ